MNPLVRVALGLHSRAPARISASKALLETAARAFGANSGAPLCAHASHVPLFQVPIILLLGMTAVTILFE